jgi:hypothetical protein
VNTAVRQLLLMSGMKFLLTIVLTCFITCELMTVASAQRKGGKRVGGLINANKPGVFISFLRSGDIEPLETGVGSQYLWFRITNNTRWAIWLDMSGVPTKQYGDASLYYTIENKTNGAVRIDARCHVCSVNPLKAGRALVFSIPADHASRDTRLRIEYSFEWERDNETEGGSYSNHSVDFYFSYLPKSISLAETLLTIVAPVLSSQGFRGSRGQTASR